MKAIRLDLITSGVIVTTLTTVFTITVFALVGGGSMYSPGALNAIPGNVLGGVSSHADIAGNCKACHSAPWETDTMDDRCLACHVNVAAKLIDPASIHGRMKQIDPQAKCRTCHPEHNGPNALLTVLEGWQFPHDVTFFSLKGHQRTALGESFLCEDCHGNDVTQFDMQTCQNCHINMDMTFMVEHQKTFGKNCLECHDGVDRYGDDFDHNVFAFKLTGRHVVVACSQCHIIATTVSTLQATGQDCFSCHVKDDPHQGSLGTDCASCHSPDGWSPTTFDHNRSQFKLNGAHVWVTCEACHLNGIYKGTPQNCFSCHQEDDSHRGQLGSVCEKCHTTEAWRPAQFDHNTTGFILTGSHVNVNCSSCHTNGTYKNTPRDCFYCHNANDVHRGQFGRNCEACHQTTTWSGARFDHNNTAFPLIGNHVTLDCSACHKNDVFRGTPKECFSCHAKDDVHTGQFGTNCSICHIPIGWKNINFDHNTSAFPLTGKHATLACRQCHVTGQLKIPTECASCHTEPTFHAGALGTNCVQCHTTTGWSPVTFAGTHPVALGQNFLDHHGATCKTCHTTTVFQFTCLACHETNPLSPDGEPSSTTGNETNPNVPISTETSETSGAAPFTSISPSTIQVGVTGQVTVILNNVPAQGYTSTEFTCTYDPALVDVSNINVGNLFGPDAVFGISDPQDGSFIFAVAGSKGWKVSGSGTAFTFDAKGLQAGNTKVECKARVSEGLNVLQSIDSSPSIISIAGSAPIANSWTFSSITGQVLASKLVTIRLYNPDNSIAATNSANPDGTFSITLPKKIYTIIASAEGFLDAQGSVTFENYSDISMSVVNLIAGDIDNNGVIDSMDALTIGMNYNKTTPAAADINNDNLINVIDLEILAKNYGKSGALFWP